MKTIPPIYYKLKDTDEERLIERVKQLGRDYVISKRVSRKDKR